MKKVLVILLAVLAIGFTSGTAGAAIKSGWDIYLTQVAGTTSVDVNNATRYFLDNTYFRQNERDLNTSCSDGPFTIPAEVLGEGGKYCVSYQNGSFVYPDERTSVVTPLGNPGPYAKGIDGFFFKPGTSLNQGDKIIITLTKADFCESDYVLVNLRYNYETDVWETYEVDVNTSVVASGGRINVDDPVKNQITLTVNISHLNAGEILALVTYTIAPDQVWDGMYNPTLCFKKSGDGYENQYSISSVGTTAGGSIITDLTTDLQGFADSKWQFELSVTPGSTYISLKEPSPFQHFEYPFSWGEDTDDISSPRWSGRREFESDGAIVCWGNNARGMIEDPMMLYGNNVDGNPVVVPATLTLAYADAKNDFSAVLKSLDGIFWDWTRYNDDQYGDQVSDVGFDGSLNNTYPNREAFLPTGEEISNCRTGDSVLVFSNNPILLALPTTNLFGGLAYWVGQNQGVHHNNEIVISVEGQEPLTPRKFILDATLDLTGGETACSDDWVAVDRSWLNQLTHEWFLTGYVGTVNWITSPDLANYYTIIRINNGNTQDATVYVDGTSDDGTVKYFNVLAGTVAAGKTMVLNQSILAGLMPGLANKNFTLRISVAAPSDKVNVFAFIKGPEGRVNLPVEPIYDFQQR